MREVRFIISIVLGDVNLDGLFDGLDVDPLVDVLLNGPFQAEADMNEDQFVNGLDVQPFLAATLGSHPQQIPEPTTLLLGIVALSVIGGWRRVSVHRSARGKESSRPPAELLAHGGSWTP